EERADGDAVGVEGIGGQSGPGQPDVVEGEHLAGATLTDQGPVGAVAGGEAAGAADSNLLLPVVVGLGEGDAEGEVLAGAGVAGPDELIQRVGAKGCRGGAAGGGGDGQDGRG